MVEYSLCVCYGFIVNKGTLEKVEKYHGHNDDFEEFEDDYVRCVNAWAGEEYFIGLYDVILDDGETVRFIDDGINVYLDSPEIDDFKKLLTKFKITEIIGKDSAECRQMLINFCY